MTGGGAEIPPCCESSGVTNHRSRGILGGRFRQRIDPNRVRQDFEARRALHEALGMRGVRGQARVMTDCEHCGGACSRVQQRAQRLPVQSYRPRPMWRIPLCQFVRAHAGSTGAVTPPSPDIVRAYNKAVGPH